MTTALAKQHGALFVSSKLFSKQAYLVTLRNASMEVHITNIGATITAICTPDRKGLQKNIVAGFDNLDMYYQNPHYFGSVVGRYANRIADGKFVLDGKSIQLSVNNQHNHLHGGFEGFHRKTWHIALLIERDEEVGVVLEYFSKDGEEGYPGNLQVQVQYVLNRNNELQVTYTAVTDKTTPVNLTNHTYFNLTGFEHPVITDHVLQVQAAQYTEKNERNLPTGKLVAVAGTPLDFSSPRKLGAHIQELPADKGFDHNYVLDKTGQGGIIKAAELYEPSSGRYVAISTDQPGMQLYTANWWDGSLTGAQGKTYVQHGAVALETQAFPDSPNHAHFPNTLLAPGETYRTTTIFAFGVKDCET